MNTRSTLLLVPAALAGLTALAGACDSSGVHTLVESTTETIRPSGGSTKSAEGLLTLTFPNGAVAANTEVTIVTDRTQTIDGLVSPVWNISPRGLDFDAPIAVDIDAGALGDHPLTVAAIEGGRATPIQGCAHDRSNASIRCSAIDNRASAIGIVSIETPDPNPDPATVERLAAGAYWTCAHMSDLSLNCWGGIWLEDRPQQKEVPSGPFAEVYDATYHHTCALKTSGEVDCFGQLMFDQEPPQGSIFAAFTVGGFHNCGLYADGTVECWGYNEYNELDVPPGTFTAISAGITHTCGLREDGTATCWGAFNTAPPGVFTRIEAGGATCGQRVDGSIECWSGNWPAPSGAFVDFSVGVNHACAVRADGSAACWGSDESGSPEIPVPAGTWKQISAGFDFSCGINTAGEVSCWGRNDFGQTDVPAGL